MMHEDTRVTIQNEGRVRARIGSDRFSLVAISRDNSNPGETEVKNKRIIICLRQLTTFSPSVAELFPLLIDIRDIAVFHPSIHPSDHSIVGLTRRATGMQVSSIITRTYTAFCQCTEELFFFLPSVSLLRK